MTLPSPLPSSSMPLVTCIAAALHVPTSDLTPCTTPSPFKVHMLTLGVLPAFHRHCLTTCLLRTTAASLRGLAANVPQVPTMFITLQSPMCVCVNVVCANSSARALSPLLACDSST
jgi:hypothetical protein